MIYAWICFRSFLDSCNYSINCFSHSGELGYIFNKKKQTEYYTKITEPQLESGGENGLSKSNRSQGEPVFYEHVNNSLLSVEDLPPRNLAIPLIKVQCTYGNNFNFEVASKLATLNYIILKKYYDGTDVKIMLEKPLIDEATTNSCNIIQGK